VNTYRITYETDNGKIFTCTTVASSVEQAEEDVRWTNYGQRIVSIQVTLVNQR
jgi:hypothetical protein